MNTGETAERLRRSTVQVVSGRGGSGSGVIVSSTGHIVTNAHVIRSPNVEVELWDGRRFPVRIAAFARRHDLALLKAETIGLPAATFGDSSILRPGELVLAVGNPLGFVGAVSSGIVYQVGPLQGLGPNQWVQAAVRLAPGNSGGPLVNAAGEIIGINTMIAGGLALAIPGNVAGDFFRLAAAQGSGGHKTGRTAA
jgi:serine protease Do